MTKEKNINEITMELKDILEDATVPRNVKENIEKIIKTLEEEGEISIKVNKALNYLDEIADDVNMQSYTRTQIWNIVSLLEKITAS